MYASEMLMSRPGHDATDTIIYIMISLIPWNWYLHLSARRAERVRVTLPVVRRISENQSPFSALVVV